jgi:hypothetical protein
MMAGLLSVAPHALAADASDIESHRAQQRAAYQPITLPESSSPRQELPLTGPWLFAPAADSSPTSAPDPAQPDTNWHVLAVPQFWNEIEWWIYYKDRGTSHNFVQLERDRCRAFTFDSEKTSAGWYRQWINVPASCAGKRITVHFDAVATISQVFFNGHPIAQHVGMFSPFDCDLTPYLIPGKPNLLSVYVAAAGHDPKADNQVAAVAVTMAVTHEMLTSIPHTTYPTTMAGIWQPVKLIITSPSRLDDVYFRPTTNSAIIESTLSGPAANLTIRHTLFEQDPSQNPRCQPTRLKDSAGNDHWESSSPHIEISNLTPKLWSPEHPNLYYLRTELLSANTVIDSVVTPVGFRTFEAHDGKFFLNGKPYFLRGANMPPAGIRPNDAPLADRFLKLAHDGNQMTTRFHMCPPPKIWMDSADRNGVGVSIEGSWPWVCIHDTPVPSDDLKKIWYDEMEAIAKANRNHPSLLLMTMANESHFQGNQDPDPDRRLRKYQFFSDAIARVRATAVGVPVIFHSGYIRPPADYNTDIAPHHLDDGDADDGHYYFGWYTQSPFAVNIQKDIESREKYPGKRPLFSQESSTGYPDNDTGHPVESYIRIHRTPQAWVGHYGLTTERPDMFLDTHAFITKEMTEKIRRDRKLLGGWGLFANSCWYRDVFDAQRIDPYPVYYAVQLAYSPVLVSLVTANRHYDAGQSFTSDVVLCNDDPDRPTLHNLTLHWRLTGESSDPGTSGTLPVPDCAYDSKTRFPLTITVPTKLPEPRSNLTLLFELYSGDELISRNQYTILAFTPIPAPKPGFPPLLVLEADNSTSDFLAHCGILCKSVKTVDWNQLSNDPIVIARNANIGNPASFSHFLQHGAALLLEPGITSKATTQPASSSLLQYIPTFPTNKTNLTRTSGDFADCLSPALLDGLDPMDLHWWTAAPNDIVRVCRVAYQFPPTPHITGLVRHVQPHAYIKPTDWPKYCSWPVFEVQTPTSTTLVSSLFLADDPVARAFYHNLITRLQKRAAHQPIDYTIPLND